MQRDEERIGKSDSKESLPSSSLPNQVSPLTNISQSFGGSQNLPFAININIEAKDPESIRELVNLLRELRQQFPTTKTTD